MGRGRGIWKYGMEMALEGGRYVGMGKGIEGKEEGRWKGERVRVGEGVGCTIG